MKRYNENPGVICAAYTLRIAEKLIFERLYINLLIDLADLRLRSLNMGHIVKLFEGNAKILLESLLKI